MSASQLHPPLFILSCERSGSTLLRCLLDTHSDVAAPGELLLGDLCARWLLILERTVGQVEAELAGDDAQTGAMAEVRRSVGDAMDRYCRAKGARLWCEKTPANLNHADLLARVFPQARFLCLYRHGLDVALSCLEASRWGFMNEVASFVAMSPENLPLAMTRNWMVKTATLLDFEQRHAERCFRLRYEDLVERPDERLGEVLDWLGLPREAGLAERAFSVAHDAGGGDPGFWRTRRVRGDRVGRGVAEIRQRLPAEVFPRLDRLLTALGYPAP